MAITTTEGSYQDYAYTGGMQKITIAGWHLQV